MRGPLPAQQRPAAAAQPHGARGAWRRLASSSPQTCRVGARKGRRQAHDSEGEPVRGVAWPGLEVARHLAANSPPRPCCAAPHANPPREGGRVLVALEELEVVLRAPGRGVGLAQVPSPASAPVRRPAHVPLFSVRALVDQLLWGVGGRGGEGARQGVLKPPRQPEHQNKGVTTRRDGSPTLSGGELRARAS